jgi:predicted aspartyl protease
MAYQLGFPLRYHFKTTDVGIAVPFSLRLNEWAVSGEAKIDTGSEFCFFQRELADRLRIEVEDGYPIRLGTLAGTITAYAHTVELDTLGIRFESLVLFTSAYETTRSILGRRGWLENLHLALTMDDEMLYLRPAYSQDPL